MIFAIYSLKKLSFNLCSVSFHLGATFTMEMTDFVMFFCLLFFVCVWVGLGGSNEENAPFVDIDN